MTGGRGDTCPRLAGSPSSLLLFCPSAAGSNAFFRAVDSGLGLMIGGAGFGAIGGATRDEPIAEMQKWVTLYIPGSESYSITNSGAGRACSRSAPKNNTLLPVQNIALFLRI